MDFILTNITDIVGVICALVLIAIAIYKREWSALKAAAYQLMLSAERLMATDEGQEKFDKVFESVWEKAPAWFKKLVSEATLKEKLQEWYDKAKDLLKSE